MTKSVLEVVTQAHRDLEVVAVDEDLTTDMLSYGTTVLQGLLDEAATAQNITLTWGADETPDGVFLSLAFLLATHMAPHYVVPFAPMSRGWGRFRAAVLSDDRTDDRDLDEDGTISEDEAAAGERARFY